MQIPALGIRPRHPAQGFWASPSQTASPPAPSWPQQWPLPTTEPPETNAFYFQHLPLSFKLVQVPAREDGVKCPQVSPWQIINSEMPQMTPRFVGCVQFPM